ALKLSEEACDAPDSSIEIAIGVRVISELNSRMFIWPPAVCVSAMPIAGWGLTSSMVSPTMFAIVEPWLVEGTNTPPSGLNPQVAPQWMPLIALLYRLAIRLPRPEREMSTPAAVR